MNFPNKLREARINRELTQEELAKKIFVSRTLITKYESGDAIPTKENIEKLAIALNIKISDLMDAEDSTLLTLDYAKYSIISNYWFNIIAVAVNIIWIMVAIIPMFGTWKYIYPITDGMQPDREYYYFSLIQNSLAHNNYVVLWSIIVSIFFIITVVTSFFMKNKKIHFIFKWIIRFIFVVCLFLILFGLVFGLGNADL